MRKFLSVLLALSMVLSLTVPAFAASPNEVYDELEGRAHSKVTFQVVNTCEHEGSKWVDNKDGTHDEVCVGCGEVMIDNEPHVDGDGDGECDKCGSDLNPDCMHPGSSWVDNEDGTHDEVCTGCGEVLTDDEKHVDGNDDGVCDKCGAELKAPECGHDEGTHWVDNQDGKTHDEICNGCGGVVTDDEEHVDEDGDRACDKCGALIPNQGPVLIATVPLKLPILMDLKGNITVSSTAVVQNHVEDRAIAVTDITLDTADGWTVGNMADDFNVFEPDSKILAMSFRHDTHDVDGVFALTAGNWNIGAADALNLNMAAKVPVQTKASDESEIADVEFVLNWATDADAVTSDADTGAGDQDDINVGNVWMPEEPETPVESVEFTVDRYNRYMVGYTGAANEELVIPAEFDGPDGVHYVVKAIGDHAFDYCKYLSSVMIPNTVTSVGSYAFYGCNELLSVTIPDSVTSIGASAFSYCTRLPHVVIPDSVTFIGRFAFCECKALSSVVISDGVTCIEDRAFQNCSSLSSVVIPDSVTSILFEAFYGCTSLSSVVIPDSVTSIGNWAFEGVPEVIYNGTATGSPWGAKSVVKPEKVETVEFTVTVENRAMVGYTGAENEELVIPAEFDGDDGTHYVVKAIADEAFRECAGLSAVVIPSSVETIGEYAFFNCINLSSVSIPFGVTSIGVWAFARCTSLLSIVIPGSIISIGDVAFDSCTSLSSVVISDGVTSIGNDMFNHCTSLSSVVIPDSVISIGESAFVYCTSLLSIVIPSSVTSIDRYAFAYCTQLSSVTVPSSVTSIGVDAFKDVSQVVYSGTATGSPWGADSVVKP